MTLKKLRLSKKLSQRQVAETLGVVTQTIRNWEAGRSEPLLKVGQVYKWCQLYGCSLIELVEAIAETQQFANKKKQKRHQNRVNPNKAQSQHFGSERVD